MSGEINIVFTSLNSVRASIIHGWESFLELSQVQDNRSFISEKIKTGLTSGQSVNHISDRSIELARRHIAHIGRLNEDTQIKEYLIDMGNNIVNLVTKDDGDSFITSIFPFYSCISVSQKLYSSF